MAHTDSRVVNIPVQHIAANVSAADVSIQPLYQNNTKRQTSPMFPIRDNTVFQSGPSLNSYNTNGVTGETTATYYNGNEVEAVTVGHLSPPELHQIRSTSPRRLILKGNGSGQHGSNGSPVQWQSQQPQQPPKRVQQSQVSSYEQKSPISPPASSYYADAVYQPPMRSQTSTQASSFGITPQAVNYADSVNGVPHSYQQSSYSNAYNNVPANYSTQTVEYSMEQSDAQGDHFNNSIVNHFALDSNGLNRFPSQTGERSESIGGSLDGVTNEHSVEKDTFQREDKLTEQPIPAAPAFPVGLPPPPPPPIPEGGIPTQPQSSSDSGSLAQATHLTGLAAALKSATLKAVSPKVETSGIPAPLVGTKAVLMEEMQRKLARRRAKADGEDVPSVNSNSKRSSPFHTISRSNTNSPSPLVLKPTPQPQRESPHTNLQSGGQAECLIPQLEQLKQELLIEIRQDLDQLRFELLAAIKDGL